MSIRPCLCAYFCSFPELLLTPLPPPHLSGRWPHVTRSVYCWWATCQTAASGRVGEINEPVPFICTVFPRLCLGTLVLFWIKLEYGNRKCVWNINNVNKKGISVWTKTTVFDSQVLKRRLYWGAGSCETCLQQKLWCFPPFCINYPTFLNERHSFFESDLPQTYFFSLFLLQNNGSHNETSAG